MVEEIQIDELFTALQDGKIKGIYTPVSATGVIESKYGAFLHIKVSYGAQTNHVIVEANLKKIIHHEPANVTGDGCPSYPRAVAQELPNITFTRDLVHETRNVRKKKRMKKQIKTMIDDYRKESNACWKQGLQTDRQHFIEQLLKAFRDQSKTKKVKSWLEEIGRRIVVSNHLSRGVCTKYSGTGRIIQTPSPPPLVHR